MQLATRGSKAQKEKRPDPGAFFEDGSKGQIRTADPSIMSAVL
jgi:hypothetical protein